MRDVSVDTFKNASDKFRQKVPNQQKVSGYNSDILSNSLIDREQDPMWRRFQHGPSLHERSLLAYALQLIWASEKLCGYMYVDISDGGWRVNIHVTISVLLSSKSFPYLRILSKNIYCSTEYWRKKTTLNQASKIANYGNLARNLRRTKFPPWEEFGVRLATESYVATFLWLKYGVARWRKIVSPNLNIVQNYW